MLLKPHFVSRFHGSCFINHKTFVSFLWIKSFKWYVLGSWTFLTCKKRRQNHSYPLCNFNNFGEVLFHFLHKFFLTQCNTMASYLINLCIAYITANFYLLRYQVKRNCLSEGHGFFK